MRTNREKYSIAVIGVYFGKLPEYFNLWLKSCEYNKDVSFIVFGDMLGGEKPENVQFISMKIEQMKALADKKLGLNTGLSTPYKCCDFRPAYGIIFEDYLKGYDFWGHCDFDVIFGNIRGFINEEILYEFDKVLPMGHLSLYRNTPECNSYYKLPGSTCGDYKKVFESEKHYGFDEWSGIYKIYKANNLKMYDERIFADISVLYTRLRRSLKDKNYKNQAFYWENGKVLRAYSDKGRIKSDEFIYIHFQKRGFKNTVKNPTAGFYITPNGFCDKKTQDIPQEAEVKAMNPYNIGIEAKDKLKKWIFDDAKIELRKLKRCILKRKTR